MEGFDCVGFVSRACIWTHMVEKGNFFAAFDIDMCEKRFADGSRPGNSYLGMQIAL